MWVLDALDDHARYLLAARAVLSPTTEAAWACFEEAATRHGMPRQLISDNGLCFTGRLHGRVVEFERRIRSLGVVFINSGPYHPETLGKLERFHKTLKEWLADEGPPQDLAHLQQLLDRFRHHYNEDRPHQGIADLTPADRYRPNPALAPPEGEVQEPTYPRGAIIRTVWPIGVVTYDRRNIGLGKRWAGCKVRIVPVGKLVHVYYGKILLRSVTFEPGRRYHGLRDPKREVTPKS